MRDYYDIHVLLNEKMGKIQTDTLKAAFEATCKKRKTLEIVNQAEEILRTVGRSETMEKQWDNYRESNYYVGALGWGEVFEETEMLAEMLQII